MKANFLAGFAAVALTGLLVPTVSVGAAGLEQTLGGRAEPVLVAAAPKGSSQPGSKSKPPHAGPKSELPQQSGGAKGGGGAGSPEKPKPGSKAPLPKPGAKSDPPGQAGGSKPGGTSKAAGKPVEMTIGAYLLPDLRIVQIGVHKLHNAKLRIKVENAGDGSSEPTVLDVTSTEKKTGKVKRTTAKVAALLPKDSAWITVDTGVPAKMLKKVDLRVDWQNQVKESNDQNNRAVRYF